MLGLGHDSGYYKNPVGIYYYSKRYNKFITVPKEYESDGATGALDVSFKGFMVHDWICGNWSGNGPKPIGGQFDDGTKINNWQASQILSDILRDEGRWFRKYTWFWATWLRGGGKARDNGMF